MDPSSFISVDTALKLGLGAIILKMLDILSQRRPTRVAADVSISQSALEWTGRFAARMDQLEAQLAAAQEHHTVELRERDARIELLERENAELRGEVDKERTKSTRMGQQLKAEQARVAELERVVESLAARVAGLEGGEGKDA